MSDKRLVHGRAAQVLLVEDNDNDAEIAKLGFGHGVFSVDLHRVQNGEECMHFLRKQDGYGAAPTPDLILLDLNMPRMDGLEVLEEMGRDERLKHLLVVVLTSSKAEEDVLKSYRLRCNSYLVKPINFAGFAQMVQGLSEYWFSLAVLPPAAN